MSFIRYVGAMAYKSQWIQHPHFKLQTGKKILGRNCAKPKRKISLCDTTIKKASFSYTYIHTHTYNIYIYIACNKECKIMVTSYHYYCWNVYSIPNVRYVMSCRTMLYNEASIRNTVVNRFTHVACLCQYIQFGPPITSYCKYY